MAITDKFVVLIKETMVMAEEVAEEFVLDEEETIDIQYICLRAMYVAIDEREEKGSKDLETYVKDCVFNRALDHITLLKLNRNCWH